MARRKAIGSPSRSHLSIFKLMSERPCGYNETSRLFRYPPVMTNTGRMKIRLIALCLFGLAASTPAAFAQDADKFYKERIEPVLKKHCFECHSHESGESNGQLMLDSMTAMSAGGTRGAAVIAGKPAESQLMKAISYQVTDLQMPPDGKLPDAVIEDFRKWIESGAQGAPAGSAPAGGGGIKRLAPEDAATHWAYRLPQSAELKTAAELGQLGTAQGLDRPEYKRPLRPLRPHGWITCCSARSWKKVCCPRTQRIEPLLHGGWLTT